MSRLAVTNYGLTLELELREQSAAVTATAFLPSTERVCGRQIVAMVIAPAASVDLDADDDTTRHLWIGHTAFELEEANVSAVRAFEAHAVAAVRAARKAAKQ